MEPTNLRQQLKQHKLYLAAPTRPRCRDLPGLLISAMAFPILSAGRAERVSDFEQTALARSQVCGWRASRLLDRAGQRNARPRDVSSTNDLEPRGVPRPPDRPYTRLWRQMHHLSLPPTSVDRAVAQKAARHTNPLIHNCARTLTWVADEHVLGAVAAVVWLLSRRGSLRQRALANHVAATVTAAVIAPKLIKQAVDRTRPDRVVVGDERKGVKESGKPHDSFPSGHSAQHCCRGVCSELGLPSEGLAAPHARGHCGGHADSGSRALEHRRCGWVDDRSCIGARGPSCPHA